MTPGPPIELLSLTEIVASVGVLIATPILIAALGETVAERAGVLNIGVEGIMEWGALVGFVVVTLSASLGLGFLAGVGAGVIFGVLVAVLTVTMHVNQFYCGIALWVFSIGMTSFIYRLGFGAAPPVKAAPLNVSIPVLREIPVLGPMLFDTNVMTYIALILTVGLWVFFDKTKLGLWVTATGHRPEVVETVGVDVVKLRYICLIAASALGGLAGAHISLVSTGFYYSTGAFEGLVAGRGWMAIIVVNFGSWKPFRILFGAFLIGISWALQLRLQTLLPGYPVHVLLMLPYVMALAFMFLGRVSFPDALGKAYIKER